MYKIPYAQPAQSVPYPIKGKNEVFSEVDSIYVCGDHRGGATLNAAIASGRKAARKILSKRISLILNYSSKSEASRGIALKKVPIVDVKNSDSDAQQINKKC